MVDRSTFFEAMGLGPVWTLRQQPSLVDAPAPLEDSPSQAIDLSLLRGKVKSCQACGLCKTRQQTVFADGLENGPLMVVGEAPGAEEDSSGLPFVGRAGQLLDRMLHAVGASRARNVYIANVLKCRPPGNRDPEPAEIEQCFPYLAQQIQAVAPQVLLLVGRFAIQTLLNTDHAVGKLRGRVHAVEVGGLSIPAVVTYHPAYLLRRPEEKAKAWDDLLLLKQQAECLRGDLPQSGIPR
ncbi:MAG TPA: uracil-DNA glycosylase [Limnobacter sp.]|nr:uracil-DNA glycosylase [Limnobacter sp.]